MGPTLATPDEECWAALTQWKAAGMLVDSGCTDHIVTNIDAFLDFVPIQSVVRNPNGEASRVVGRGCVRISIPSNKGEFQCGLKNVRCVPDYSSNLLSVSRCTEWGHSFTFERGNSCMKLQKGTRVKLTQENNLFYLPCSVLEFKMSSNSMKLDSARKWHSMQCVRIGQDHKDSGTKSGRDPSRREAGEGVHRRDGTFQSRVTVRVPVLHSVCRPVHEVCVCGLA